MHGVILEQGATDYQIFQRGTDNTAQISISGRCEPLGTESGHAAYVRVCHEDTGMPVVGWTPARMTGLRFTAAIRLPLGGPYRLETAMYFDGCPGVERALRGDIRLHLYVGDLFVIAGQSNSAGYAKDFVPDMPRFGVHVYRNSGRWDIASHPLNDATNSVYPVNTECGNPGHSPWLSFGKTLYDTTCVPIGLIQSALGGSPLSDWMPDGKLFESMLLRIEACGGAISGMLWYQGCADANADCAPSYFDRFSIMLDALRKRFPGLPVFTAQINRYTLNPTTESDASWGLVKEAQRRAASVLDTVHIVPTNDCATSDAVHISASGNLTLGLRFAGQVLSVCYHRDVNCLAPDIIEAVRIHDNRVVLRFVNVYGRLYFFDREPCTLPLRITDAKGDAAITHAVLHRDTIELETERPLEGAAAVSMAYGQNPSGTVPVDIATYLPVLSFYNVAITDCRD